MKLVVTSFFSLILQLALRRNHQTFDLRNEIVREEECDVAFVELMSHRQDVVELAIDGAVLTELPLVTIEAFRSILALTVATEFDNPKVLRNEVAERKFFTVRLGIGDAEIKLVLQIEEAFALLETLYLFCMAGEHQGDQELVVHDALVSFHIGECFQEGFVPSEYLAELTV